jgi:crotonobetainyl-CoA hydratase
MNHTTSSFPQEKKFQYFTASIEGGIATFVINRPEVLNAFHAGVCAELGHALDLFEADNALSVAVITGSGERAFSAGFDLQYAELHPEVYEDTQFGSEMTRRLDRKKPLIAAVNGVALGFGFELALACDLIIASSKAQFGLPEVKVGLAAMAGGVVRLTRELGPKRALGLALTGDIISAAEGYRLGFVNEVTEGNVLDKALEWAKKLASNAPLSLAATKEMAYRSLDLPDLETALDPSQYPAVIKIASSEDAHEGRRAFLGKRKPQWQGK